jgi:hypothetical protein
MLKINIVSQLLGLVIFATLLNQFNFVQLLISLIILCLLLLMARIQPFIKMLSRFKWLFLVMMLVFTFSTPGEHIGGWTGMFSPTYEGVSIGGTQVLRIIVMLAALSLILTNNSQEMLISGLYYVFSPLRLLKVDVERFVARLWLTLHYVETRQKNNINESVLASLKNLTQAKFHDTQTSYPHDDVEVVIKPIVYTLLDFIAIIFYTFILISMLYKIL